ncbi:MAG: glyoxalase/bleomycin resistance/dioxygenase family protein [Burkholderiales bacterium]
MKRFHVHVAVDDLAASITFYSNLFGQPPSKHRHDYAKWMLEDPRLNFAISSRGLAAGVNHVGMQVDSAAELVGLKALADSASGGATRDQGITSCCYANSEKHWTIDPQGLAWEHFHTMSDALTYGADMAPQTDACCIPLHASNAPASLADAACCVPQEVAPGKGQCCG